MVHLRVSQVVEHMAARQTSQGSCQSFEWCTSTTCSRLPFLSAECTQVRQLVGNFYLMFPGSVAVLRAKVLTLKFHFPKFPRFLLQAILCLHKIFLWDWIALWGSFLMLSDVGDSCLVCWRPFCIVFFCFC